MKVEEIFLEMACCPDLDPAEMILENEILEEAEYQGKTVELNSPKRGGTRKFYVYVKNDKGNVIKVSFGDPNGEVRNYDPVAAKSFLARQQCSQKTDRTTPGWWSCNVGRYAKQLGLRSNRTW